MGSYHPGITLFAHVDGSVVAIADGIDVQVYKNIATVKGGEASNDAL
jgi:hypothetical protein